MEDDQILCERESVCITLPLHPSVSDRAHTEHTALKKDRNSLIQHHRKIGRQAAIVTGQI